MTTPDPLQEIADNVSAALNSAWRADLDPVTKPKRATKPAPYTMTIYGFNPGDRKIEPVSVYEIGAVEPFAQRERTVTIKVKAPRQKLWRWFRVPDEAAYAVIEKDGKVVYDSRTETDPPGAVTASTPGMTPAVQAAIDKAKAKAREKTAAAPIEGEPVPTEAETVKFLARAKRKQAREQKKAEHEQALQEHRAQMAEIERKQSGPLTHSMTPEEARALTDEIKADAEHLWDKITRAYTERAWESLYYESWDAYCSAEFGSLRLRLPREERREVVTSMRDAGLSNRAIASATGISEPTVRRDQKAGASNDAPDGEPGEVLDAEIVEQAEPEKVTGTDGKRYPAKREPKDKPEPQPRRGDDSDELAGIHITLRKVKRGLHELLGKAVAARAIDDDARVLIAEYADSLRDYLDAITQVVRGESLDTELRRLLDDEGRSDE